jgi:hypothetical protein
MSALLLDTHFADRPSGMFLNGQRVSSPAFARRQCDRAAELTTCRVHQEDVDWNSTFARPNARFTWPGGRVTG